MCSPAAVVPALNSSIQGLGMSKYWKSLCEEVAAPLAARTSWSGQSACWERMKQEGCFAGDGRLSWRSAQENLARKGLVPFPEIVPFHPLKRQDLCQHASLGAPLEDATSDEVREAKAWLQSTVAIYVLSLEDKKDSTAAESLAAQGVNFTVLQGVDLALNGSYKEAQKQGSIPVDFNFSHAESASRTMLQGMDGVAGAVGLAASHLQAMQRATDAGDEAPLVLILEDDATLVMDFAVKLKRLVKDEAPCDWVAISLQSACPYGECVSPHLTRVRPNGNEPEERCRHGANFGFYSMLYRKATLPPLMHRLKQTVWDEERPRCLDLDVALASLSGEVAYYAVPKVQAPGMVASGGEDSSRWKNTANAKVDLGKFSGGKPGKHKAKNTTAPKTPVYYSTTITTTSTSRTSTTTTTSTVTISTTSTSTSTVTSTEGHPWWEFWSSWR